MEYAIIIHPDNEVDLDHFPFYKYSDELFDWFYSNLVMLGDSYCLWEPNSVNDIDIKRTKEDHSSNGCRIWFKDGSYTKLYETLFMIKFNKKDISNLPEDPKLSDLVNYYYEKTKD